MYAAQSKKKFANVLNRGLDAAVDACYGKASFKSDLERLKFLFALYRQHTVPLVATFEIRYIVRTKC